MFWDHAQCRDLTVMVWWDLGGGIAVKERERERSNAAHLNVRGERV